MRGKRSDYVPKISVIVPVYKAERYLKTCVDSIRKQTFADLEILLIDDGSPDGCGRLCDEFAREDPRIRVFHVANGGVSRARNLGLAKARGEYVGFVDSDDYIEPDMYETLYYSAQSSGASIVEGGYYELNRGRWLDMSKGRDCSFPGGEAALLELVHTHTFQYMCCTKLYRRECVDDVRFPLDCRYEDIYFVSGALAKADRVQYVSRPFYRYRLNENSFSLKGLRRSSLDILKANQHLISLCAPYPRAKYQAQKRQIDCCRRLYAQIARTRGLDWAEEGKKTIVFYLSQNQDFTDSPLAPQREKKRLAENIRRPGSMKRNRNWRAAVRRAGVTLCARFPFLLRIYRKRGQ